ncbi:STP1 protein [Plasmodium ovale wallikeri]|uniref:STP1 protein n=2 Tax=Plasmodium ovale TaxID=36330 RepID=A0A1C3KKB9_PLAOA|nr:STP1 protein [Plasmodium ovale wallikeri]SBT74371.1 STP1 protein [Plasmodium ovale]
MAGFQGYATNTRDIDINVFLTFIQGDIKKLINTYGHKNCGLRQEELCDKIKEIIPEKKKIIFAHMNALAQQKWSSEWNKQRSKYFSKLYDEEGFINMCFPTKYKNNPSLNQLLSKHIKFCKEKDDHLSALEKNREYNQCINYNSWIDRERKSFTTEYLRNVNKFKVQNVNKYFSTKKHPGGHDPLGTYRKSKLDCKQYNLTSRSNPKIPVAEAPTNKLQPSREPNVIHGSQGKDGGSVKDKDGENAKTKPEENKSPKPKSPTPDSPIPAPSKTQTGSTHTGQDTHVRSKAPASAVSRNRGKPEATPIQSEPPTNGPTTSQDEAPPLAGSPPPSPKDPALTPTMQSVPKAIAATSLFSTPTTVINTTSNQTPVTSPSLTITSGSSSSSDPIPPADVIKGHDGAPQSNTSSDTLTTTHPTQSLPSAAPADLSLPPPQAPVLTTPPVVNTANEPGTPASSSASGTTTTVTTITATPVTVTTPTMSTIKAPIISTQQAPSAPSSQEATPPQAANGPKATESTTVTQTPTPLSGGDIGGVLVTTQPVTNDGSKQASLSTEASSEHKDTRHEPRAHPSNIISQTSGQKPDKVVVAADAKLQGTINQIDQMHITSPVQIRTNRDNDQLTPHVSGNPGKIPGEKSGKGLHNNSVTSIEKNDNPNIIPESIPPLIVIIPTLLVILATVTLLFQFYKYTPFGFLLGRRRKRKKRDLRRTFIIPEKPAYDSPNITVHEWEDPNLGGKTVENDVYIKLLKTNRYKQEMQKRKKENKKTLIEVHMEIFEEYKNDEWELHKGDFLEICLREFINDENDLYSNFPNSKLTINNIKNEKTIEDIQKQDILWNNWIENHRNILEKWKKQEWFHILKNKWRNEEKKCKKKNDKLQENTLNQPETYSIIIQKDIWKQWISKQASLIKVFYQEDWFKALVDEQNKEKDNYGVNKYNNNVIVTNINGSENEKSYHEPYRRKKIKEKLIVQMHMMVLEECIKEDIMKNKETCIDNYIKCINNKNNYEEK